MKTYELRDKRTGLFLGNIFNSIRQAIDFINYAQSEDKDDIQILRDCGNGRYSQVVYK